MHVVSMDDVMINFGEFLFQSKLVNGAVCSGVFELDSSAKGCSFSGAGSRMLTLAELLMLFVTLEVAVGSDHRRR